LLKSVRVYFNTKRMSAILKMLQNRAVEVELKSEVVEFNVVEYASQLMKQAERFESDAVNKLKQAVDLFKEANKKTVFASDEAEKGLKMAKELGVPVKHLEQTAATAKRMLANHKRWISTISTMK